MTANEFWRLIGYSCIAVFGLAWAMYMLAYARKNHARIARWSALKSAAASFLGIAGLGAILSTRFTGARGLWSEIFTIAVMTFAAVLVVGSIYGWLVDWRLHNWIDAENGKS